MSKNKRLLELDYIRVIACFSVIIVHISAIGITSYLPDSLHLKITTLINRGFKYTTPVFLFLSGITSFYSYRNGGFKYTSFLKKRMPKILIPYIAWNVVYYCLFISLGKYNFDSKMFLYKLITGTMNYHLYFIVILAQMYLLTPIFNYVFNKFNRKSILAVTALITIISVGKLEFLYSDRIFLKYLFFYVLGIYVTKEYSNFKSIVKRYNWLSVVLYVTITGIYAVLYYKHNIIYLGYVWFVFCSVSIIFLYNVGMYLEKHMTKIYKAVKRVSKSSYYIYLMHPLILSFSSIVSIKLGIQSITLQLIFHMILVSTISTIVSVLYTIFKEKVKSKNKSKDFNVVKSNK